MVHHIGVTAFLHVQSGGSLQFFTKLQSALIQLLPRLFASRLQNGLLSFTRSQMRSNFVAPRHVRFLIDHALGNVGAHFRLLVHRLVHKLSLNVFEFIQMFLFEVLEMFTVSQNSFVQVTQVSRLHIVLMLLFLVDP